MKIHIPRNVKLSEDTTKQFKKTLTEDFFYHVNGVKEKIPEGFGTDGASVPSIFFWYDRFDKDVLNSAVIHDWNYYKQKRTQKQCDRLFLACMKEQGVRLSKRRAFYRAVYFFGWLAYRKYKRN